MTTEQLLIPRYKVIADYPQPPYKDDENEHKFIEGDTLTLVNVNGQPTFRRTGRLGFMSVGVPSIKHPEKYPKIFQPLQWWEGRENEMPAYVKLGGYFCTDIEETEDVIVYRWNKDVKWDYLNDSDREPFRLEWITESGVMGPGLMCEYLTDRNFLPATEAEYLAYNASRTE